MILAIGAHPDDIELGCWGALIDLSPDMMVISRGREDALDQHLDNLPITHITQLIEYKVKELKPEIVFTHSINDLNVDHQIVARATLIACRPPCSVKEIYSYEVPSSTEWGFGFLPNVFVDITDTFPQKLAVLKGYDNEMRSYPYPRSYEGVKVLAKYRGMQAGVKYAEAFSLIRSVI